MQTKAEAFLARADKLLTLKEGPDVERVRIAIREGLLAPEAEPWFNERGGALDAARNSMDLLRMTTEAIEGDPEPEQALFSLAVLAKRLEAMIDAANRELDDAEKENAARHQRKIRRTA